jgi:periplasmic divalent cation tolerance protein
MKKMQPIVVLMTAPGSEIARQIARLLVEQKLAACVNILPKVTSIYTWEGKIQEEDELLLVAKSWLEVFSSQLVPAVQSIHPYQVPEILALPVSAGLQAYLDWMDEVTVT